MKNNFLDSRISGAVFIVLRSFKGGEGRGSGVVTSIRLPWRRTVSNISANFLEEFNFASSIFAAIHYGDAEIVSVLLPTV